MIIKISTKQRDYSIYVERGVLARAGELIQPETGSRHFIISDSGVPKRHLDALAGQLPDAPVYVFEQGEASKCLTVYGEILAWLAEQKASRKDVILALGGGVVGDLAGFVAASYMRGIRYINIPTTALSQIDSGIGGKTAIDLNGLKNIVGAFHQPSMVLVDPDTLATLPPRQLANGLAEGVKSGLIRDPELFELFESDDCMEHLDEIIYRSLLVKKAIVEEDENESSVRKLLNMGHSYGHAYETYHGGKYLHGECVAMGMMTILQDPGIRARLRAILERLGLPSRIDADLTCSPARGSGCSQDGREGNDSAADFAESITGLIMNDKKAAAGRIDIVQCDEIGNAHLESWNMEKILTTLKNQLAQI